MGKISNMIIELMISVYGKGAIRKFGKRENLKSNENIEDIMAMIKGEIYVTEYYIRKITLTKTLLSESIDKGSYQKLQAIFKEKGGFENIPFRIIKWRLKNRVLVTMEITMKYPMFMSLTSYVIEIYGETIEMKTQ